MQRNLVPQIRELTRLDHSTRGLLFRIIYSQYLLDPGAGADPPTDADNGKFSSIDEDYVEWTDEFDEGDLLDFLKVQGFDVGSDQFLNSVLEACERISLKRQLGDWIEVMVDGVKKTVTCN